MRRAYPEQAIATARKSRTRGPEPSVAWSAVIVLEHGGDEIFRCKHSHAGWRLALVCAEQNRRRGEDVSE